MVQLLSDLQVLSQGAYLQLITRIALLDDAVIRSNEPEEVLTYSYKKQELGNRFIIPWRKVKGKVRRSAMESMRGFGIAPDCHLKDALCMKCPCCVLFGGTGDVSSAKVGYNLLSRVLGDTFISTEMVGSINSYTANAVDEKTLSTGQALMTIVKVPAETEFLGVVTLRDPTKENVAILVDALEGTTRIGATTREWGRCRTTVEGYTLGRREEWASYEIATTMPEGIKPVIELDLPEIQQAYIGFNGMCAATLKQFDGSKKATKK